VEINYFGGRLNLKTYWLVIGLAGRVAAIFGYKLLPAIDLDRAIMVGSADRSFGSSMGKFKRARAQEPVLGKIQHQKKRQNKQQCVLEVGFPLRGLTFYTGNLP
jgi:hypothetical protein